MENKLKSFVGRYKSDKVMLDILWTFAYSVSPLSDSTSYSGYNNSKKSFQKAFGEACLRNLRKHNNLTFKKIEDKIRQFSDFMRKNHDFFSSENFNQNAKLFYEILYDESHNLLVSDMNKGLSINKISRQDKDNLNSILCYIMDSKIKICDKKKSRMMISTVN